METQILNSILPLVISTAKKAGAFIRKERENFSSDKIEVKGLNDLVSYVDKTSEAIIVKELQLIFPEAGFIVEENTLSFKKEYNWIVDPLDGTTNFIHGIPCYAVSIALEHKGEIILGVVYEVSRSECFYAISRGGAFLNEKPIVVSKNKHLKDCLIATGFPIYNFEKIVPYLKTLEYFMRNTHGIRRIGAAAADLCYLACGRVDAFFEYNLNSWDVAAGVLIVKEAGGKVSDFKKSNDWLFGKELIAANPTVFDVFSSEIQTNFSQNNKI
ncbi:MAG: inositol monophosphatase family protein [Bacteroidota bacterium]|nr:inositol monophosphatase family protein [Bacteroidota bacterium]MDP3146223.1 inositol monophosphatase family protein [Bacteroidota bacterium]MDP3556624.1 inositol monophosphatase family protein [Bacteroidota bacterium]